LKPADYRNNAVAHTQVCRAGNGLVAENSNILKSVLQKDVHRVTLPDARTHLANVGTPHR
jgi:hypothetical protein